jgi:transcriptional regulator with XRE-family HTH domain
VPTNPTRKLTNVPFSDELPRLLAERDMSTRELARRVGVSHSHISRVVRRRDDKTPSPDLVRRISVELDLPEDYFPEYRESVVIEHLKADPKLRDELYKRLGQERPQGRSRAG